MKSTQDRIVLLRIRATKTVILSEAERVEGSAVCSCLDDEYDS